MLINARIQIAQGSHTSDVYSHDTVLVALVLENKGATGHANASSAVLLRIVQGYPLCIVRERIGCRAHFE